MAEGVDPTGTARAAVNRPSRLMAAKAYNDTLTRWSGRPISRKPALDQAAGGRRPIRMG